MYNQSVCYMYGKQCVIGRHAVGQGSSMLLRLAMKLFLAVQEDGKLSQVIFLVFSGHVHISLESICHGLAVMLFLHVQGEEGLCWTRSYS